MKEQQKLWHAASVMVWFFAILVFYLLGGGVQGNAQRVAEQTQQGINLSIPQADTEELSATRLEAVMRQAAQQSDEASTLQKQRASAFQWHVSGSSNQESHVEAPPVQVADVPSDTPVATPSQSRINPVGTARRRFEAEREAAYQTKNQEVMKMLEMLQTKMGAAAPTAPVPAASVPTTPLVEVPKARLASARGSHNGFYGLSSQEPAQTDIRAVIHGEHRNLERGGIVKLRLLDAIVIEESLIPANTFLYGQLSLASCRAMIRIQNIQYQNKVYPFVGTIYDKDGFEGLYVPDNKIDEAARKAGSRAIGTANVRIPGASFVASAVNSALGAVQSVAQQVVGQQKINISSNYLVTIKQKP